MANDEERNFRQFVEDLQSGQDANPEKIGDVALKTIDEIRRELGACDRAACVALREARATERNALWWIRRGQAWTKVLEDRLARASGDIIPDRWRGRRAR